ncbi:diguanylate cyclase (GGDEF)-like protein [Halanaerobium saccharolyticum]|uniref:Diguanylate cyclase (GGDEF)-like protein n=1 Tax=Halanaerobium saccharolyticum TaxID=43595 RepID=A0A4V3G5R3_9FIRM|nr:diguanylate cyclase [Halanaerobium saccharolyticum]RAK09331.1 diguanylate cyclase (GGDEF)-like protein [Halanaerobium saccharolyticum]TDW06190.1 diguanylate cyclase (GGDEF)-like protein [Halanaerobium saccharolyticum]TDX60984.1 diguanylate cyclase (GGDEF)-like protein [Halanaerobium saccharolyticum]
MKKFVFLSNRYYLLTLFLVIIIFFVFVSYNYYEKIDEENFFLNRSLNRLNSEVDVILNTYNIAADAVYNNVLNSPKLKRIFYYGWVFEDRRDNYRLYLKSEIDSLYQDLKKYYIRQLHFHFKDGTSFLRMQNPEVYGDQLFEIRESVEYVNTEQKKFVGFEEGRIIDGYRYIYPLSYNNQHIGSVELSLSFQAVTELLKSNFGGSKIFMIKNELIEEITYSEEQNNYKASSVFENYSYDQEIYNSLLEPDNEIPLNIIKKINRENKRELLTQTEAENSFIVSSRIDGNYYTGSFINIRGINGNTKAYLISYQQDESLNFINQKFFTTFKISFIFLVLTIILLTIIFANNNKLRFLAHNDQLTGVSNRRDLTNILEKEYERNQRYNNTFSFIIFDIDHFKIINDNYGHNTGDRILKELSNLVNTNIRKSDYFGRWGGEEFVVIAPENNLKSAEKLAEKLRREIDKYNFINERNVTASFGVAEISADENIDNLIKRADDALYRAKQNGRNRVEVD